MDSLMAMTMVIGFVFAVMFFVFGGPASGKKKKKALVAQQKTDTKIVVTEIKKIRK